MRQVVERDVCVLNEKGIHLYVASLIANAANRFDCEITFVKNELRVNGKSVMSLTLLAAARGTTLRIVAEGPDAEVAVAFFDDFFANGFQERA
jgi:phosphocarrier protein